jgi:2',3'-cyclic-nucleotide 2'-phosphodiesterase (5'-nucleotidase family)
MMDMYELLGYDALTIGEREFNYGYQYLKDLTKRRKLKIVSANIRDKESGTRVWKDYTIVKRNGVKFAITGLLNPSIPLRTAADSVIIDDPLMVAQELIPKLKKKADVVVLLAHLGRTEAYDLASQVEGIDVLVVGHRPSLVLRSRDVNGAVAVSSGTQGQNVGETLVYMDGKDVESMEGKVVILTPTVGENMEIAALQKDFEDQLNKKMREERQQQAVASGGNTKSTRFLGMDACVSCHEPQYEQWQMTAHAHAFQTLEKESKEATPDCVKCHVTGFGEPGGYQNQVTTAKLKDVQCEVCHGMGSDHNMFDAAREPPPETLCVTCHTPENDPSWNYAAKLPQVVH